MNYYMPTVNVIGCGYAGIECALFLSGHGIKVHIFDMHRDYKCSCNRCTGKIDTKEEALMKSLLKSELLLLGSPLMREVERLENEGYPGCIAGKLLQYGENLVKTSKNIEYIRAGISQINPREINVIATGSNTDDKMFEFLTDKFGSMRCFRHMQISPVIDNIDPSYCYQGEGQIYVPLSYDEYLTFVNSVIRILNSQGIAYNHKFMQNTIEELACRGRDAIRNYAFMPVYIENIDRPYAVVKLKKESRGYSIEGISSRLDKFSQLEIFKSIKAFKNIVLYRQADVEDAVYLNSRYVVNDFNQSLQDHNLFIAGSLLGLRGYIDAIASGLYTGMNVRNYVTGKKMLPLPKDSLIGRLAQKVTGANMIKKNFKTLSYEELDEHGDLTNPIYFDSICNRSAQSLTRFKEVYTNG